MFCVDKSLRRRDCVRVTNISRVLRLYSVRCNTTYGKSVSSSSKKVGNWVGKSVNSVVGKSLLNEGKEGGVIWIRQ